MGCNCDNNKEELRIVRGNSFHLRVQVTARRLDGTVIEDFDLGAAEPVLKMIYGGSATAKNMIVEGNDAIIYFDGKDKLGWYGMEMSGTYESEAWRWCVEKVFQIVNTNAKGNVPEWAFFADDTYIIAGSISMYAVAPSTSDVVNWVGTVAIVNGELSYSIPDHTYSEFQELVNSSKIVHVMFLYDGQPIQDFYSNKDLFGGDCLFTVGVGVAEYTIPIGIIILQLTSGTDDAINIVVRSIYSSQYYDKSDVNGLLAQKYTMPSGGIPESDLTSVVQRKLDAIASILELIPTEASTSNQLADKDFVNAEMDGKQDTLVSGTNIKTINGESVLGAGNIEINALDPATNIDTLATPGFYSYEDGADSWLFIVYAVAAGGGFQMITQTKVGHLLYIRSAMYNSNTGQFLSSWSAWDSTYNLPQEIQDYLAAKADKVSSATAGNFAGLSSTGNLTDSGSKASDFATATEMAAIEDMIPAAASSSNQLADKAFVNSSVATNTANYISDNGEPFDSLAELEAYSGPLTNNDYAFVVGTDAAGNTTYTRYKYNATTQTWAEEYVLNNSSFTASQWDAINSGITSGAVAKLVGLPTATELATELAGKADKVTGATSGNFAGLSTTGNLTDSGSKASDFATAAQGAKADTAIQSVKVNGSALTPDANKAVDVKTHDAVVSHGTSDTTFALTPNVFHTWGEVESLTLTLATPADNTVVNLYMFEFESGSTATTLSLPNTIIWDGGSAPTIATSTKYEITIRDSLAKYSAFPTA